MIGLTSDLTRVNLKDVALALETAGFNIDWGHFDGLDSVGIKGPNFNTLAVYEDGIVVVEGPHYPTGIPFLIAANLATEGLIVNGMRQHTEEHCNCTGYTENADFVEAEGSMWAKYFRVLGSRNGQTVKEMLDCLGTWHESYSQHVSEVAD